MNQYPKWLLALTFPSVIIPAGTMIFFLFGGVHIFGTSDVAALNFLLYLLTQLFWLLPIALFFLSLFLWGWTHERAAVITATLSLLISLSSLGVLIWA